LVSLRKGLEGKAGIAGTVYQLIEGRLTNIEEYVNNIAERRINQLETQAALAMGKANELRNFSSSNSTKTNSVSTTGSNILDSLLSFVRSVQERELERADILGLTETERITEEQPSAAILNLVQAVQAKQKARVIEELKGFSNSNLGNDPSLSQFDGLFKFLKTANQSESSSTYSDGVFKDFSNP
jgi:hypothetical protein